MKLDGINSIYGPRVPPHGSGDELDDWHGVITSPPISLHVDFGIPLNFASRTDGNRKKLAEEVHRGLEQAVPNLPKTVVKKLALAVGAMIERGRLG